MRTRAMAAFFSAAIVGVTAVSAPASAAPINSLQGTARWRTDGHNQSITVSVTQILGVAFGTVQYNDGQRWLTSAHPGALTVNGAVAKVKGTGIWNGRSVVYYLQVKDRAPSRGGDRVSIKIKSGKSVVLRQNNAIDSGNLTVR